MQKNSIFCILLLDLMSRHNEPRTSLHWNKYIVNNCIIQLTIQPPDKDAESSVHWFDIKRRCPHTCCVFHLLWDLLREGSEAFWGQIVPQPAEGPNVVLRDRNVNWIKPLDPHFSSTAPPDTFTKFTKSKGFFYHESIGGEHGNCVWNNCQDVTKREMNSLP